MSSVKLKEKQARLRDRSRTEKEILEAAKGSFAKDGYSAANVRDIAATAEVNAALVIRYFGSKERLFEAAVTEAFDLGSAFAEIPRHALGREMARLLFSEQREDDQMAMLLRSAFDSSVAGTVRRLVQERMLAPLAALIGEGGGHGRAAIVLALVTGIWFQRFALELEPFADIPADEHMDLVAAAIQAVVDGEDLDLER